MATLFEHDSEGSTDEADVTTGSGFGTPWTTVSKVGSCTIKYDSAQAMHGTSSIRFSRTSASDTGSIRYNHSATMARMQVRTYYHRAATETSPLKLMVFRNTSTFMGYIEISGTGRITALNTSATLISGSTATNAMLVNTWYRIEAAIKAGTTTSNGTIEWSYYLGDDATAIESWSSSAVNTGIIDPIQCRFELNGSTGVPADIWLDDPAIGDGSSGWLGPSAVAPTLVMTQGVRYLIDASASTIPSGTITYSISQTAGPTVTPVGVGPTSPTITGTWSVVPHVTDTLTYLVTATGSLGGSDSDSVDVVPPPANIPVQRFRRESGVWV